MKLKKVLSLALAIGSLATLFAGLTSKAAKGNTRINSQKPCVIEMKHTFARRKQINIKILVQAVLEALEEEASRAFGGDTDLQYAFQRIEEQRKEKYYNEKNTKNKIDTKLRKNIRERMKKTNDILLKKGIWESFLEKEQLPRDNDSILEAFKVYCNSIIKDLLEAADIIKNIQEAANKDLQETINKNLHEIANKKSITDVFAPLIDLIDNYDGDDLIRLCHEVYKEKSHELQCG